MEKNQKLKETFFELLYNIKELGLECGVGGGAAVDYMLNRTPRDIDLYIQVPTQDRYKKIIFTAIVTELKRIGVKFDEQKIKDAHDYDTCLFESLTNAEFRGYPLDIICITDEPKHFVNTFDINLTKIMLCFNKNSIIREFDIYQHPSSKIDIHGKLITVEVNKLTPIQLQLTMTKRLAKYQKKFPDHRINIIATEIPETASF